MAKILILDDEPANRLLMSTLLLHAGHEVLEAADGEAGLSLAGKEHPDLVIVDLFMPGMHGTQFIKQLRAGTETARMRVALYTGTSVDGMMRDFMQINGIAHVIPKPAEPEDVLQAITLALQA